MYHFNEIELYYEPRKTILPLLPEIKGEPEMSDFDSAFLCGCLKRFRPKKIVEVGIAGGGTTAIIDQCMCGLGEIFEHHSIDLNRRFYINSNYESGFLGKMADDKLQIDSNYLHRYYYGHVASEFVEQIDDNIDCLILDTVHACPGEIMDFITLMPHLSNDCLVILHDLSLNHYTKDKYKSMYCNTLLFSAVTGTKYINFDDDSKCSMPNIGAVLINENARKNMGDIFMLLMATWAYLPEKNVLLEYKKAVEKYYSDDLVKVYDAAVTLNCNNRLSFAEQYPFPFNSLPEKARVVIYGAGNVGKSFVNQIRRKKEIQIVKWIDRAHEKIGLPWIDGVETLTELEDTDYDYIIIAIENEKIVQEVKAELIEKSINPRKIKA